MEVLLPGVELFVPENHTEKLLSGQGTISSNHNKTKDGFLIYCQWVNSPVIINGKVTQIISKVTRIDHHKDVKLA